MNTEFKLLKIVQCTPNPNQPREEFDQDALRELASTILSTGVVSPIIVRLIENGSYSIISGERRWLAARLAGLIEIPAVVRAISDETEAIMSLVDNMFAQKLTVIEEAKYFNYLSSEYGWNWESISKKIGLDEGSNYVRRRARLLRLPSHVQVKIHRGLLSFSTAEELLKLRSIEQIDFIVEKTIEHEWNRKKVRLSVESLMNSGGEGIDMNGNIINPKPPSTPHSKFADTQLGQQLINKVNTQIGIPFSLTETKKGKIKLMFECSTPEQVTQLIVEKLEVAL